MEADTNRSLGPRILIYSQDGLGLGHMRRTGLIAEKLLEFYPHATVLTLSDSPLEHFFKLPPKHRYLKLPTIIKIAPGIWRPADSHLTLSDAMSMRQKRIGNAFDTYQPQLVLVDHMPHGAMGELLPHLRRAKKGGKIQIILGLRDILDRSDVICKRWEEEGAYDVVQRYYDLILVYGQKELYNVAEAYRFPLRVKEMVRYCGYICNGANANKTATRIRSSYLDGTDPDTQLVVALAGGGADGYPVMRTLIEALPSVLDRRPVVVVMIAGPFHPSDSYQRLKKQAYHLPVHLLKSVDDTCGYIKAADMVIAMAGYNTTAEILASGSSALLIPRVGPSAEQRTRSQIFVQKNWVEMIDPERLNKTRLAEAVINSLTREKKKTTEEQPDLNGLSAAVDYLCAAYTELSS